MSKTKTTLGYMNGEIKEEEDLDKSSLDVDPQDDNDEEAISLNQNRKIRGLSSSSIVSTGSFVGSLGGGSPSQALLKHKKNKVLFGLKWAVIGILMIAGTIVSTTTYLYSRAQEQTRFHELFRTDSMRLISTFYELHSNKMWACLTLGASYTAFEDHRENGTFPYATLPSFDLQTMGGWETSKSESIFFAPFLSTPEARANWVQYASENQELAGINGSFSFHNRSIEDGIFRLDDQASPIDDTVGGLSVPIWQINPADSKRQLPMFNIYSVERLQRSVIIVLAMRLPQFSDILDDATAAFFLGTGERSQPRSLFMYPVMNTRSGKQVVGIAAAEIDWIRYFSGKFGELANQPAIDVVLYNTCDRMYTYQIRDSGTVYLGPGDLHDTKYDAFKEETELGGFKDYWLKRYKWGGQTIFPDQGDVVQNLSNATFLKEQGICQYLIRIYPTKDYDNRFTTSTPLGSMLFTVAVFIAVMVLFFLYDVLVERRQNQVLKSAANADAMVNSLFPAVVRDKLFRDSSSNKRPKRRTSLTNLGRASSLNETVDLTPKIRLTNFLSGIGSGGVNGQEDDEPIAEMFSSTTVMFADIAGFTAWSSGREPTQVFKLLETIYAGFDSIARRLNVFKVETIGDCYVAVVGLPEPNENHAVVCAQFARQCLLAMNQLTNQLELTLGPGTSELALRIGLHSGAVTAGVLRGAKSRFQLFGDTMNTASRMESTGQQGRIQVSKETADLITKAGKEHWLTQRDGTISAKGKGEMQTYWVEIRSNSVPEQRQSQDSQGSLKSTSESTSNEASCALHILPKPQGDSLTRYGSDRLWDGVDDSCSTIVVLTAKVDRLVDWNVEVLMGFLEKVVQHRLESKSQANRWTRPTNDKSGLIIDEVVEIIELPNFSPTSRTTRSSRLMKHMPATVRAQLKDFVTCIASIYRDVPFHNFEHASHVTMSANKLMKRIITPDDHTDRSSKPLDAASLHAATFGISSDPLTQFAVVFAALIHDVDHTGFPNSVLVEKDFDVARVFSNRSVAEQNSVMVAWNLLMEPRFAELQVCIFSTDHERSRFRQLIVNAVMATDIMDPEMVVLRKKRWEKAFDASTAAVDKAQQDTHRKATIVIEHIIQASDVAHTMQHWHVFQRWNARLYKELYRSYKMGYSTKDPSEGWFEGQIGFFDHYVIPLAKKLKECGVFGVSGDEYLQYAEWNRQEWERKGREETKKMVAMRACDESLHDLSAGTSTSLERRLSRLSARRSIHD